MKTNPKHPAKFSEPVLDRIFNMIDDHGWPERILDPFAGTGRVHRITAGWTCGVELEPEWAALTPGTIVANALALPFPDASFDLMCTSPCYGNRFADHHDAKDGSERRSYTHDMGRPLHPENSGVLPFGPKYQAFHDKAWCECLRVLKPMSKIILNTSNFYKTVKGVQVEQLVTEWHLNWFMNHGCSVLDIDRVYTKRMRKGANRQARAPYENVITFVYGGVDPKELRSDIADVLQFPSLGLVPDGVDT